jgi:hypothetical protein
MRASGVRAFGMAQIPRHPGHFPRRRNNSNHNIWPPIFYSPYPYYNTMTRILAVVAAAALVGTSNAFTGKNGFFSLSRRTTRRRLSIANDSFV